MAYLYLPNGVNLAKWRPEGVGNDFKLNEAMGSLETHRDDLQIVKGLAYVPAATLLGAAVVTYEIAAGVAEDRAYRVAVDEELGRPEREIDRQIY